MKNEKLFFRLRRIEGQVRGIQEMIAKDRPDKDILIQLEAVKSAVSSSVGELLSEQIKPQPDGNYSLTADQAEMIKRMLKK